MNFYLNNKNSFRNLTDIEFENILPTLAQELEDDGFIYHSYNVLVIDNNLSHTERSPVRSRGSHLPLVSVYRYTLLLYVVHYFLVHCIFDCHQSNIFSCHNIYLHYLNTIA